MKKLIIILVSLILILTSCAVEEPEVQTQPKDLVSLEQSEQVKDTLLENTEPVPETQEAQTESKPLEVIYSSDIPGYSGQDVIELNNNQSQFSAEEITNNSFENYSPLDSLGRVGAATACLGLDTLPTKQRESISNVKPSGWQQTTYDFIDGELLYNRSHLIAYSLSAENDNEENLMTGTRYFNSELMQPYEKKVRSYIDKTGNHVMYRVTPRFTANNLIADGVQIEAYSVEDNGQGINYNVFCYNVEPGIIINYVDGSSQIDNNSQEAATVTEKYDEVREYILNTKSKKVHLPECSSVQKMNEVNKQNVTASLNELIAQGYSACGSCKP